MTAAEIEKLVADLLADAKIWDEALHTHTGPRIAMLERAAAQALSDLVGERDECERAAKVEIDLRREFYADYQEAKSALETQLAVGRLEQRRAEAAESALTRIRAIEAGWQDIESAPKDGTEIIGLYHRDWNDGSVPTTYGPWTVAFVRDEWRSSWDSCRVIESESDFGTTYKEPDIAPTHWKPLPSRPAIRQLTPDTGDGGV